MKLNDTHGAQPTSPAGELVPESLLRAAAGAERVLDQMATDIEATCQLIEWHSLAVEARDSLRAALNTHGVSPSDAQMIPPSGTDKGEKL